MKITFKSDIVRAFVKEQLGSQGFELVLKQEVDRLVNKHRKALVEDLQELSVRIATSQHMEDMSVELTIETPDTYADSTTSSH